MAKNKIQVTTAHISSDAQVVVPNCYFISKAVKAMLAIDAIRDYLKMMEADHHQETDSYVKNNVEIANDFLHELIDALEGKDENHG